MISWQPSNRAGAVQDALPAGRSAGVSVPRNARCGRSIGADRWPEADLQVCGRVCEFAHRKQLTNGNCYSLVLTNASPLAFFFAKQKIPGPYRERESSVGTERDPAEPAGGAEVATKTRPSPPFFPLHFQAEDDVCFAALCRIVSRPRPCGDGALWEIWAAGASHAGGSASSGHSAAAVPAGDDGCGISV